MSFLVYKSMFMLPAETFPQLAPTMWRSWQSWGVSSGVLTGRLTAAAQSMRETGDIITGAYWDRQHASSTAAAGFDQYIRDSATLEHIGSGDRAKAPGPTRRQSSTAIRRGGASYRRPNSFRGDAFAGEHLGVDFRDAFERVPVFG